MQRIGGVHVIRLSSILFKYNSDKAIYSSRGGMVLLYALIAMTVLGYLGPLDMNLISNLGGLQHCLLARKGFHIACWPGGCDDGGSTFLA